MPEKKIPIYDLDHFPLSNNLGVFIMPMSFSEKHLKEYADQIAVPHRHDHYCCFLIEKGSMDFKIDFKPTHVATKSLLVSYPGQIHHVISTKNCKGWILVFDAKLADENARMIIEESLTNIALLKLNASENDWFKKLFELIFSITLPGKANNQSHLIRSLLDAFMLKASALYKDHENLRIQEHSTRTIDITKKFRQLLQKKFRNLKKPSEYAELMNFSTSYLNDTVKAVTGFSTSYFIQQEIISEAQRLLYYTDMSIKEIAYDLGYEDDKYFIRIFGKQTGLSPSNFRKQKTKSQ